MEGRTFGDVPLNMEIKLEVVDAPNSAGIDAVVRQVGPDRIAAGRVVRAASLHEVAAGAVQRREARLKTESFIAGANQRGSTLRGGLVERGMPVGTGPPAGCAWHW